MHLSFGVRVALLAVINLVSALWLHFSAMRESRYRPKLGEVLVYFFAGLFIGLPMLLLTLVRYFLRWIAGDRER